MDASPLGTWHILATTLPFWRGKAGPTVTYAPLADGRWHDVLRWRQGARTRSLEGHDRADGEGFLWRGKGLLGLFSSRWRFVELTEDHAVTWFARATWGVTPEGMDVYGRRPDLDPAPILARIQADSRYRHLEGWFTLPP